jgi:hypothetical protein
VRSPTPLRREVQQREAKRETIEKKEFQGGYQREKLPKEESCGGICGKKAQKEYSEEYSPNI